MKGFCLESFSKQTLVALQAGSPGNQFSPTTCTYLNTHGTSQPRSTFPLQYSQLMTSRRALKRDTYCQFFLAAP